MTHHRRSLPAAAAADAANRGDLVTITEAAHALQLPARTVRSWVDRGHLPAVTVEGRMRVDLEEASRLEHARRHACAGSG